MSAQEEAAYNDTIEQDEILPQEEVRKLSQTPSVKQLVSKPKEEEKHDKTFSGSLMDDMEERPS